MSNTTISGIVNEIKGQDDSVVTTDSEQDYIRRIAVSSVTVTHVQRSYERNEPLYKDALIVVSKNDTTGAGANQYSVTRYWQNIFTNWIESEHLFDVTDGPYDDFFVFDDYAITIKDQNKLNAVFYTDYVGNVVNSNLEVKIYDDMEQSGETFQKVTFWE